jgi:uncharacterized protein (TIGR00730 family)
MKSICVFCGSSSGTSPIYLEVAQRLGLVLASANITLVYGGASIGVMGALADAALQANGNVTGVIPYMLNKREVVHTGLTDLRVVGSMHERKALMVELADGFIALPGGIGTLEELFEVWTWGQLGVHEKPCGLLNVNGYFNPLLAFIGHMVAQGFLREEHRSLVLVDDDPETLLARLREYRPPKVIKWVEKEDT